MVQILPQKTNVGSQIGQALGQGLQQGMGQGLQRGMLQQALGKVRGISQQTQSNPMELMLQLMEAGAGIPGSERYLGALLPTLLNAARAETLYGQGGQQAAGNNTEQMPAVSSPAQAFKDAKKFVEGDKPGGFLAAPMNPEQMEAYAERYATTLNDPNAFDQGLMQAERINQQRITSRNQLQQNAIAQGIQPDEIPRFLQNATKYEHLEDPTAIERAAIADTKEIRNLKDSLKNLTVPGVYAQTGGVKAAPAGAVGGIVHALLHKGKTRDKFLKQYDDVVGKLVNQGEEPYVRETLAKVGLSPTEIEERIHPLTDQVKKNISSLPAGNQLNDKARHDALVNFFRKNVDQNASLSVLRHYLWKDKGYDWREIQSAVQNAFPNADRLTKYQAAELSTLGSPPKQSLSEIFGPTPDIAGFFRGEK